MKFDELTIDGFGRLSDTTVAFARGITCLIGANESGKSTIHTALRAGLYGIDKKKPGRGEGDLSPLDAWRPWKGDTYGIAVSYTLDAGGEFRVSRNFAKKNDGAQVMEIGGKDITSSMYVDKLVVPGFFHLGLDEDIFSATAWLSDDGLELASREGMQTHVALLRSTIERLVDTGISFTAREAIERLKDAAAGLGTERKTASPLGKALKSLKALDEEIDAAAALTESLKSRYDELDDLDLASKRATEKLGALQRRYFSSSLAALSAQRNAIEETAARSKELEARAAERKTLLTFSPAETMVLQRLESERAVVKELLEASEEDWAKKQPEIERHAMRKHHLTETIGSLPPSLELTDEQQSKFTDLKNQLKDLQRRPQDSDLERLRSKISNLEKDLDDTGLSKLDLGSIERMLASQRSNGGPAKMALFVVAIILPFICAGAAYFLLTLPLHPHWLSLVAGLVAGAIVSAILFVIRSRLGANKLESLASFLSTTSLKDAPPEKVSEAVERTKLLKQALTESRDELKKFTSEMDDYSKRIREHHADVVYYLHMVNVDVPKEVAKHSGPREDTQVIDDSGAMLDAVSQRVELAGRKGILEDELDTIAQLERQFGEVFGRLNEQRSQLLKSEEHIRALLQRADIPDSLPIDEGIQAYYERSEGYTAAVEEEREYTLVSQQLRALGQSQEGLDQRISRLEEELARFPDTGEELEPLSADDLPAAEHEISDQEAVVAKCERDARDLLVQLEQLTADSTSLADLHEQREILETEIATIRERIDALDFAAATLESLTLSVHETVAEKLTLRLKALLPAITDSRYSNISLDPEDFSIHLLGIESEKFLSEQSLSHGTRDQLALLMRIALSEVFSENHEPIPLLLDEPLLSSDPRRRAAFLQFLSDLSETHQILITTTERDLASYIEALSPERHSIVELSSPQAG